MIPYEDLCAALEAYAARNRGESVHAGGETQHSYDPPPLDELPAEEPRAVLHSHGEEDATHAGMQPVYEDRSNELDVGDVLSDEDL